MKITKAFRYTALFSLIGLAIIIIISFSQWRLFKVHQKHSFITGLTEKVKNKTAYSQLYFGQLLAGDRSVNFEMQVVLPMTDSKALLQAAYDGRNENGIDIDIYQDEETKALLKESIFNLDYLTSAVKDRHKVADSNSGDGNNAQAVAEAFKKFESSLENVSLHLNNKVNDETRNVSIISWSSVVLIFVTVVVLSVVVYRNQYRSDKALDENKKKFDEESKRVDTMSQFIEAVSAGNYEIALNDTDDDNLTATLISMRDKLRQNAEDDRKRNWSTTGLAQIGEILRANTSNSSELYDNIIRFLVKYTKSNQGGLFILNDETENSHYLELMACYAFERKKYLKKKVAIGDGLVGQCYLEGQRIYLLEVPQEYISITSGLGGANPNALLIVPMKVNDKIYGVIELATFNKFEDYEIELVEKLAESIASTISNVRVNDTTRMLLERTQQQAEEMKSQEEEIRQNMEELEATQEEMRRKQTILEKELEQSQTQAAILREQEKKLLESQYTLQAIVDNIPRAIFWKDKDLRFMGCNIIFAQVAGESSPANLIGKSDFDMSWSAQADAYRKDDLEVMRNRKSKLDIEEVNISSDGTESWVKTSKVPIVSESGEVVAILGMFEDITAWKRKEADVAQKLRERDTLVKELQDLKKTLELKKA